MAHLNDDDMRLCAVDRPPMLLPHLDLLKLLLQKACMPAAERSRWMRLQERLSRAAARICAGAHPGAAVLLCCQPQLSYEVFCAKKQPCRQGYPRCILPAGTLAQRRMQAPTGRTSS